MTEQLNHFIAERLYDASLSARAWPTVLDELTRMLGATGIVVILSNDPACRVEVTSHSDFVSPDDVRHFHQHLARHELPAHRAIFQRPPRELILDTEFWPDDPSFLANPANRWIRTKGTYHRIAASLNLHRAWYDLLAVHVPEARWPPGEAELDAIRLLLPHLSRILELNRAFSALRDEHEMLLGALDRFAIAIGALDLRGRLVIANSVLRDLVQDRDAVALDPRGCLVAATGAGAGALQAAIDRCIPTLLSGTGAAEAKFALPRRSTGLDLLADLSPIRDPAGTQIVGSLLLIIDPEQRHAIRADHLEQIYRLTDAERIVCDLVLDGHSNTDIADIRSVSVETVKSQVRSLFQKTQTANRFALARLAVTVNPPVRDRLNA
jgi:DNA-binding CsgD family transcriptional regulator